VDRRSQLTPHKLAVRAHFDSISANIERWQRTSRYYRSELQRLCTFMIPPGAAVLELGSGTGDLLASLRPSRGVGIDLSPGMVEVARRRHPDLTWIVGDAEAVELDGTFDYIVLSDLLGHLEDIVETLRSLRSLARPETRVIITYYNYVWEPVLALAERLGQKTPVGLQNWLPLDDIENFLFLADFDVMKKGHRLLFPKYVPVFSHLMNRVVAQLPLIRRLDVIEYVVARPRAAPAARTASDLPTTSVIIPCRNESGNIAAAVERIPEMGPHTEIIFVDGASSDGTRERIASEIERYRGEKDIKLIAEDVPKGKGHAVRVGFDAASGDVLMILDADLTVAPEDLPKFYSALVEGKGDLINGSRLVYPMEREAMRFLNLLGNKVFGMLFSWTLEERISDTLCGTKVLRRTDYQRISANRAFFGDFDPFGDFDLLFGAAKLNMKITELPVRYRERTYGTTKISRFRHGLLLLQMSWIAIRKLKFG
jgi:ubiquinone/menaquinone biosynthesis C-methylase UbiE